MENENIKPSTLMPGQQIPASCEEDEGLAVAEIVAVVMEHRWLVAGVTALALSLGIAWSVVAKPVYRADGLLQVEEKAGGMSALKELQPLPVIALPSQPNSKFSPRAWCLGESSTSSSSALKLNPNIFR